jgi:polysaccharide biosynthesis PFTS motif protein
MIHKNFLLLFVERIFLLMNRSVSQELAMQKTHVKLLQEHFYTELRLKLDSVLQDLRLTHNQSPDISVFTRISQNDVSLASSQKLILRTIHSLNFNKAIVYSKTFGTRIWFPIDRKWRDHMGKLGLQFNGPICSVLLVLFKSFTAFRSFLKMLGQELKSRSSDFTQDTFFSEQEQRSPCVYLSGFTEGNFPNVNYDTHNFFDWFASKVGTDYNYIHDCIDYKSSGQAHYNVFYQQTPVPKISLKERWLCYLILSNLVIRYVFNAQFRIFDLLSQVDEVLISLKLSRTLQNWNYSFAIFPSTVLVAQPLWSKFLEKSGTSVVLVHYTAMAEPLSPSSTKVVEGIWHLSSWTDTWVVDEDQALQMKLTSIFSSKNYLCVGVPYWSGRIYDPIPREARGCIAVFDTHIRSNQTFGAGVVDEMGWNDPLLEETFIKVVLEVATQLDLVVLHKKKRKVSQIHQQRVDKITERLKLEYGDSYQPIDESFSANSLIGLSVAVVSKPISTTALVATAMGKPSIIFDPTMNTQSDDPGLRDCKLAYTADQLFYFIKDSLDG